MEYFAALPAEQLAAELQSKIDAYYQWLLTSGRLSRWRIAYDTYYGQRGQHNSSYVTAGGDKGELSFLMSNEYRNLLQHLLVLAFQSRPAIETVAINRDSTSRAQSYLAKGIIEYYRRDGKVDDNTLQGTEIALIMDVGWVFNEWDTMLGQEVAADPETGELVRQGDISSRARTPLDVVIDITKPQGNQRDWIMVKDPKNKFDLAAQYPELAEDLTSIERDHTRDAIYRFGDQMDFDMGMNSPDVDVWTFYHRRSPAMPEGRMFQFVTPKLHLFDGPIPYRKLPGNRICPTEQILSALGYSNGNDLLGLQDVMDALISSAVTNMTAASGNTIWTKPSPNFDYEEIAKGMSLIEADEKPEVLIMNRLPPEWLALANFVIGRLEAISGINSVARGNLGGKDLSGTAMALLQSMAIQFNNGLVRAVNRAIEESGNDIIQLTQDFASEPRLGMIVGQQNRYMMKKYAGKDVAQIQRVYCRQSNPMKDTTAGKMQLLDKYMSVPGMITDPSQITEVLETGSLDSTTDPGRNLLLSIDEENEALMRGEVPPVVFTDNHPQHLSRHGKIFASPEDRQDPGLIERSRTHYDMHMKTWRETPPDVLAALGIPPYPGPPPLPPGAVPPGAPPGPGGPPPGGPIPPGSTAVPINQGQGPDGTPTPNLPENPLTGEKWTPETGGLPPA